MTKYTNTGFIDLQSARYRHPLMKELLKMMKEGVGKPCGAYADGCPSCRCWLAYATLDAMFEMRWDEEKSKKKSKKK